MKIQVTSPQFDNIGNVLLRLNIPFTPFKYEKEIKADFLFMNCGTSDSIDPDSLRSFVKNGGVFYASDLTSDFIDKTFPNIFVFSGSGSTGEIKANIVDARLIEFLGKDITVKFDMGGWSQLSKITQGKVILERLDNKEPLMVEIPYGRGIIYYTSFHNHAQVSEKEDALLEILVLTQISSKNNKSISDIADSINFDLSKIKDKWGGKEITPKVDSNKKLKAKIETKKDINIDDFDFTIKKKIELKKTNKPNIDDFNF